MSSAIYAITDRSHLNYGAKCTLVGRESSGRNADCSVSLLRGGEVVLTKNGHLKKLTGSAAQMEMSDAGVGVWNFREQKFIEFVPCPGEKRVRIDVYDGVDNYGVFAGRYEGDVFFVTNERQLKDWRIDLT